MKFSFGAILALAAAVLAKPQFTNSHYEVQEDVPFTLTWSNADGPVTISLMAGPSGNLKKVTDLACKPAPSCLDRNQLRVLLTGYTAGVTGNSVPVTLSNLPSGQYAFRITDSTNDPNYSPQFEYAGTATASPSDSTTTVSSTTNSSSSTSTSSVSTTSNTSTVTSSSSQSSASTTGKLAAFSCCFPPLEGCC